MSNINHILRIDASAREDGSITRSLADETLEHLAKLTPVNIVRRDVADNIPFVDAEWVGANFTPPDSRNESQAAKLSLSDTLIEELKAADTLVIATPIYNFGIPASLKAWIDLIARAGVTFRYSENGPVGLLHGKRAVVLIASGGTPLGSGYDFASPYLKHMLAFIGITDVEFIAVDAPGSNAAEKRADASNKIRLLKAA